MLANIPRLVTAYFSERPDPADPAQRVAFGTSGHRGSSLKGSLQRGPHPGDRPQAICEYRARAGHRRAALPRAWTPTRCPSRRS
ncbi:MAG: hypothetical protein MZV65_44930 [Chromatiales bacterium]|nr:hypothetical protein [Chromatiales bacterium]